MSPKDRSKPKDQCSELRQRPVVLDLFCGAGGAAAGYARAGFDVVGVDINPQPNYPFLAHRYDALAWVDDILSAGWVGAQDAIHASPPCQAYSAMSHCRPGLANEYEKLIAEVRSLLDQTGLPYVIENVERARPWMRNPATLCGFMFGRELYRHRLFETNWPLGQPDHPAHTLPASKAGHWSPGTVMSIAGHVAPIAKAREVMEIDWTTRDELAEAIPPYYTEYVGTELLAYLAAESEAVA